ncbi:YhbP family protein [Budvicia diplopodorum]|uniref:YhbP family protein n=1 Tax=Budvicia diplopodorum TaxID=1119056 RepID=UPI00135BDC2A|nr:YhbP family protein [Budvicia diplopodorum]
MTDDVQSVTAICRYLAKNHVLTLCTVAEQDLWCASCFYTFEPERMAFIIMSETHTRHAKMALVNPLVAGTVAAQTKNVALIQGVQFRGRLSLLDGEQATTVRRQYIHRFPVAKLVSAPVWRLTLDELKMTDNKLGFGKKLYWQRGDD